MDFSRILIVLITLQACGLGVAGLPQPKDTPYPFQPPKGMDITDLKSSIDAILANSKNVIAKAMKAKDPMVQYMAQMDKAYLNQTGTEFSSYDKNEFIKEMSEGKSERPAMYMSDDFLKAMLNAATMGENWNFFTMTFHDGGSGPYGALAQVYNYMVRWNAKTSKVDVVFYAEWMPVLDKGLLYSFEGTAKLPQGKLYEDSQIFDGKYKPMTAAGISV